MNRLLINQYSIEFGLFDFLGIKLKNDIGYLIDNYNMYSEPTDVSINFLSVEMIDSKEMEHMNQGRVTDVLTLVYPRGTSSQVDSCIFIDPLFVTLCLNSDIEFENSYLNPTLSNRIIELVSHGILHSTGMDHHNEEEKEKMFLIERMNNVKTVSRNEFPKQDN